jgi:hypothetical protein
MSSQPRASARWRPIFILPAVVWLLCLLLWPACQRYFPVGARVLTVVISILVLVPLAFSVRGTRILVTAPLWVLIVWGTICMWQYPFYSLADYLNHPQRTHRSEALDRPPAQPRSDPNPN